MRLRGNRALLQRLGNSYYSSIFPKDYLTQKTSSLSNGCVEEMLNYSSQGSVPVSQSAICLMTLLLRLLWVCLILVQTRRLNAKELVLSEGQYLKLNLDAEKASKCARLPDRPSQFFFIFASLLLQLITGRKQAGGFFFLLLPIWSWACRFSFLSLIISSLQSVHLSRRDFTSDSGRDLHSGRVRFTAPISLSITLWVSSYAARTQRRFDRTCCLLWYVAPSYVNQHKSNKRPYVYNSNLYFYILLL